MLKKFFIEIKNFIFEVSTPDRTKKSYQELKIQSRQQIRALLIEIRAKLSNRETRNKIINF